MLVAEDSTGSWSSNGSGCASLPNEWLISCKRPEKTYVPLAAIGGQRRAEQRAARVRRLHRVRRQAGLDPWRPCRDRRLTRGHQEPRAAAARERRSLAGRPPRGPPPSRGSGQQGWAATTPAIPPADDHTPSVRACTPNEWLISCKQLEKTYVPLSAIGGQRRRGLAQPVLVGCISGLGGPHIDKDNRPSYLVLRISRDCDDLPEAAQNS